jgi:hypothetical protein
MVTLEDPMGQHARFDIDTYNQTKNLSGGPVVGVVYEEIPFIEPATDEQGNVTRSGKIAYLVAYAVAAVALGYWFWM